MHYPVSWNRQRILLKMNYNGALLEFVLFTRRSHGEKVTADPAVRFVELPWNQNMVFFKKHTKPYFLPCFQNRPAKVCTIYPSVAHKNWPLKKALKTVAFRRDKSDDVISG